MNQATNAYFLIFYIFTTRYRIPLKFQTMNSVRSNKFEISPVTKIYGLKNLSLW